MTTRDDVVPVHRPHVQSVLVGKPVLADDWYSLARLVHWLDGRGTQLVPMHRVAADLSQSSLTLRYFVPRSRRSMMRAWVFDFRNGAGTVSVEGSPPLSFLGRDFGRPTPTVVTVDVTPSTAEAEISALISTTTSASIASVGVYEVPRYALSKATEGGLSLDSFFPRRPIHDSTSDGLSTGALIRSAHSLTVPYVPRRIGHVGRSGEPLLITSASYQSLTWTPYRVVPRRDAPGETVKKLRGRVYGSATSGSFRLVVGSSGPSSTTATIPAVAAWTAPVDVEVNCEDKDELDGAPSGVMDTVDFQVTGTNVSISSWVLYEFD